MVEERKTSYTMSSVASNLVHTIIEPVILHQASELDIPVEYSYLVSIPDIHRNSCLSHQACHPLTILYSALTTRGLHRINYSHLVTSVISSQYNIHQIREKPFRSHIIAFLLVLCIKCIMHICIALLSYQIRNGIMVYVQQIKYYIHLITFVELISFSIFIFPTFCCYSEHR